MSRIVASDGVTRRHPSLTIYGARPPDHMDCVMTDHLAPRDAPPIDRTSPVQERPARPSSRRTAASAAGRCSSSSAMATSGCDWWATNARRVMHAGVHARVGDERRDDAERDPGLRPSGADAAGEGEGRRGMTRGPGRRARHCDLARDKDVVHLPVRPSSVTDWLEHQVDLALRRLSRAASYSRLWLGCSAVLAACGGKRGGRAAENGLTSIALTSAVVQRRGRRHSDRRVDGQIEPVQLIHPRPRAPHARAVGRLAHHVRMGAFGGAR
jgi:hypothetical protein